MSEGSGFAVARLWGKVNNEQEIPIGNVLEAQKDVQIADLYPNGQLPKDTDVYCFRILGVDKVGNEELDDQGSSKELFCTKTPPSGGGQNINPDQPPVQSVILPVINKIETYISTHPRETTGAAIATLIIGTISTFTLSGMSFLNIQSYYKQLFLWLLGIAGYDAKAKRWGIVYDSVTKDRISRAVVRLFSGDKLIATSVTDIYGVFYFMPKPGTYTITVNRPGYKFPSETILGSVDNFRKYVYHGEKFSVTSEEKIVNLHIPLDLVSRSRLHTIWGNFISSVQSIIVVLNPYLLVVGAALSLINYTKRHELIDLIIFFINIVLLLVHFYIKYREKTRWGRAVDQTGKPLSGVEIGIFDPVYNKLVDTRVTDEKGRFIFIALGGKYLMKPTSNNYVFQDTSIAEGLMVGKNAKDDIILNDRLELRKIS